MATLNREEAVLYIDKYLSQKRIKAEVFPMKVIGYVNVCRDEKMLAREIEISSLGGELGYAKIQPCDITSAEAVINVDNAQITLIISQTHKLIMWIDK